MRRSAPTPTAVFALIERSSLRANSTGSRRVRKSQPNAPSITPESAPSILLIRPIVVLPPTRERTTEPISPYRKDTSLPSPSSRKRLPRVADIARHLFLQRLHAREALFPPQPRDELDQQ